MIKLLKNVIIILGLFSCTLFYGQTKNKNEVPFDLDKLSLGQLPFDEYFYLSGFTTEYDKILLDKHNAEYCQKPAPPPIVYSRGHE